MIDSNTVNNDLCLIIDKTFKRKTNNNLLRFLVKHFCIVFIYPKLIIFAIESLILIIIIKKVFIKYDSILLFRAPVERLIWNK